MAESHAFADLLAVLVALIIATKLLGWLAHKAGLPAVLGELVAGVLLGGSLLRILDPNDPVIFALAQLGVLILLFEIGLHTELASLTRVGRAATTVAVVGVALPFAAGYAVATLLGLDTLTAIVCGAALTATSIGISARVLSDLGRLNTDEGRVVLGAAVIDDVIGLIILSVVSGIAAGITPTPLPVLWKTALAFGFIAAALLAGRALVPMVFGWIERMEVEGTLGLFGLAFAFLVAWIAEAAGSAMIVGAFSAGLVLNGTRQKHLVQRATTELGHFFVPVFFATVGAAVDIRAFADARMLSIAGALVAVGVVSKFVAGYAPWWFSGNKALIGAAMIPRGEVGLIFAQVGLAAGAINVAIYSALTLTVMVTTFLAPFAIQLVSGDGGPPDEDAHGGIDDLVAG